MKLDKLKIFYLSLGIVGFVIFIWTGRILRFGYPVKEDLDMGFRVMLRSRHIFLLLFSLTELGIGTYIQQSANRIRLGIQTLATILIVAAHVLFLNGFFNEVNVESIPETPVIHWATYLAVAGILLHLATTIKKRN